MNKRSTVFLGAFFFALELALVGYVNSELLKQHVSTQMVSLLFIASSVLSCIFVAQAPHITRRIGAIRFLSVALFASAFLLFALANVTGTVAIAIAFVFYFSLAGTTQSLFDLLLEYYSTKKTTGSTRGFVLSLSNLAWFIGLGAATLLLHRHIFNILYVFAGVATLIALFLVLQLREHVAPEKHQAFTLRQAMTIIRHRKALGKIFLSNLMLQLFYSVMVVFSGIYLSTFIPWESIILIFAVMQLPFVFLQYPFGIFFNTHTEKTTIVSGFLIMGLSIFFLATTAQNAPLIWFGSILFISRIGAAMVEVGSESWFFKSIDENDTAVLGVFRAIAPFSFILAGLIGLLFSVSYPLLFCVVGLLIGITAWKIHQ